METINLTFRSGQATLAGTLATVDQTGPGPAVLLLSGSGPIDRDSDTKRLAIGVMGQVADHLAGQGLASFRYDKRGVGASSGDYKSTGLYDNVADAGAAVDTLRARPDIDPDRLFVIGHSEGALIAAELAAADPSLAGVVLLAGTATPGEDVLRWQAEHISASLPRPVKFLLRVLRQDVVRTQTKRLAHIKATTGDTARIQLVKINAKWFREFMAHDPAPSLASIQIPVLALTGSKDIQVNPEDIERICQLVPADCSGQVIDDLTHLLRTEAGPPSVRTYKKQAKRPVDPALLATTSTWIRQHVTSTATETTP
jgi:pimeloyl-ACP methyl ester carboxylesterase